MTLLSCGHYTIHINYLFSFFLFTKKKATLTVRTVLDPKHPLPIQENISFENSFGTLSIVLHQRSESVWRRKQHYIKIRRQVMDASCAPPDVQNDLLLDLRQKK